MVEAAGDRYVIGIWLTDVLLIILLLFNTYKCIFILGYFLEIEFGGCLFCQRMNRKKNLNTRFPDPSSNNSTKYHPLSVTAFSALWALLWPCIGHGHGESKAYYSTNGKRIHPKRCQSLAVLENLTIILHRDMLWVWMSKQCLLPNAFYLL